MYSGLILMAILDHTLKPKVQNTINDLEERKKGHCAYQTQRSVMSSLNVTVSQAKTERAREMVGFRKQVAASEL